MHLKSFDLKLLWYTDVGLTQDRARRLYHKQSSKNTSGWEQALW